MSSCYLPPVATINNIQLPVAETFCYLGSRVTYRNTLDDELTARVAKAGAAFGQLSKRLWMIMVYVWRPKSVAILSSLLYGSETWTPYRRRIKKLDNFHMKRLRRILNLQWQDRIPNTEILNRCKITGVEVMIMQNSYVGADTSTECRTVAYRSSYCTDNWQTVLARSQGGQRKR